MYRKLRVGSSAWVAFWRDHPELQDEMVLHAAAVRRNRPVLEERPAARDPADCDHPKVRAQDDGFVCLECHAVLEWNDEDVAVVGVSPLAEQPEPVQFDDEVPEGIPDGFRKVRAWETV